MTAASETPAIHTYCCRDQDGGELYLDAESPAAAATEYVESGDWGEVRSTIWIDVRVFSTDADGDIDEDHGTFTREVDPDAPACARGHEHEWCSPIEVVGGIEENPGVWGKGGGVTITELCRHCRCYREIDTWAQRSDTGEQGLRSVSYRRADETSRAWEG